MKNNLHILLCFILQIGCNNASKEVNKKENSEKPPLDVFKWLLGSWESISPEGHFFETWEKENNFTYSGLSYMAVKKDTVFFETIKLITIENKIYYVPTVRNQNDDQPVLFKLISEKGGEFIFENKDHNFPQRIIYKNSSTDKFYARIEGIEEGKFHKEEFIFDKILNNAH